MEKRKRARTVLVGLLLTLTPVGATAMAGCAPATSGGDWPSLNGDLANSRNQAAETRIGTDTVGSLTVGWSFVLPQGQGAIDGTPAVADGCVYVATNFRNVYALNADTGELVWQSRMRGSMWSSPTVYDGKVFVHVNAEPRVLAALDHATGEVLWETAWDDQAGTMFFASPVAFNEMVLSAISGIVAEESTGEQRYHFRGRYALLDADTGAVLDRTFVIPDEDFARGLSGAGLWATPAVDLETGYAYEGTGNPYSPQEHQNSNAIIKIDVDPQRPTFGDVVGSFHGTYEQVVQELDEKPACRAQPGVWTCVLLDVDFGASPQLFEDGDGRALVGGHQKSGMYHVADAGTMERVWSTVVGGPWIFGGAATASYDRDGGIYVAGAFGQLFALNHDAGDVRWVLPMLDTQTQGSSPTQVHSQPTTTANGVLYTIDGRGVLIAYDAATGAPLLVRPLVLDTGVHSASVGSGIAIARHQVYVPAGRNLVMYALPDEA